VCAYGCRWGVFVRRPAGSYTVSAAASTSGNWTQTCPPTPGTYTVALANSQIVGGRDFAFAPLGTTCADLWVNLTAFYPGPKIPDHVGLITPCCGSNFTYRLDFGNSGNAPSTVPGVITLVL